MADSSTKVLDVYGDNIDARTTTTTGDKRLVVVVGDPATDAAVAPVSATLGLSVNCTAGSALIGKVSAVNETSTIYNGTTALTPQYKAISAASAGDNTIVDAVAGKKIRVIALHIHAVTAVAARFESAAGGTALTGVMSLGATSGITLPPNPWGWFETEAAELLNLELGGAVQTSGLLVYVEV